MRRTSFDPDAERRRQEVAHGQWLAAKGPERIWGWATPAGRHRAMRRAEWIVEAAGMAPGVRVLEVGCGTGTFTQYFAASGAELVAIDLSAPLLEQARRRLAGRGRVSFVHASLAEFRADQKFDAVVGSSVLHHLELEADLAKIRQLLRPGGRIAFGEPNMLNPQIFLVKNIKWLGRRMGESESETAFFRWILARRLAAQGFESIRIRPRDWLHPETPPLLIPWASLVERFLGRVPVVREFAGSLYLTARLGPSGPEG